MSPKRTLNLVVFGFLLFNVILLYLVVKPEKLPLQTLSFPDGSTLELTAVTFGTNHVGGSALARSLRHLPAFVRPWFKRVFGSYAEVPFSYQTATPQLVLWFKPVVFPSNPGMLSPGVMKAILLNEENVASGQAHWLSYPPAASGYLSLKYDVFPRRAKLLQLQVLYERARVTQEIGRVKFVNPARRDYPHWSADALPATLRSGDVEVTLESFTSGYNTLGGIKIARQGFSEVEFGFDHRTNHHYAVFIARVRKLTESNAACEISEVTLADATGNVLPAIALEAIPSGGVLYCAFEPCLWPDERAWKLRLEIGPEKYDRRKPTKSPNAASKRIFDFMVQPRPGMKL